MSDIPPIRCARPNTPPGGRLFFRSGSPELFAAAMTVCRLVGAAGGRALLVGGCVRDALLKLPCDDLDIECHHISADTLISVLKTRFDLDAVGMSFGVLKLRNFAIDIALPRTENKSGSGHRGFLVDVATPLSYAEAAARRDFTVNAVMYDPLTDEVIDPWHGVEDLQRKLLRHVSPHFAEDPLRVLRAMQFAARFNFAIAPETVALCRTIERGTLAVERVCAEWSKLLLRGRKPSLGLQFLRDCRWITDYPELAALDEAAWRRTLASLDRAAGDNDLCVSAALLAWECENDTAAASLLGRIILNHECAKNALLLIRHGKPAEPVSSDAQLRRLALNLRRIDRLCRILEARGQQDTAAELETRASALGIFTAPPAPLLQGRHLLARGIPSGPAMGKILQEAFEAQLDGEFSDPAGAQRWLESHH